MRYTVLASNLVLWQQRLMLPEADVTVYKFMVPIWPESAAPMATTREPYRCRRHNAKRHQPGAPSFRKGDLL
jgi:hypothetical protein